MAKPRRFDRYSTDNKDLNEIQDRVEKSIEDIASNDLLGGVVVSDAILTAGETTVVRHSLGRVPKGRQVTAQDAQAQIWNAEPPTKGALYLGTSADVTVSFWVF